MSFWLYQGDCRQTMSQFQAESVDAVVTDAPYELGFLAKGWDKSGVSFDPITWQWALHLLKPGGYIAVFGGTRTFHRMACAIEDAGFQLRDTLCWLYGQGFPKSMNLGGGYGTALKPAWESIVTASKPVDEWATIGSCLSKLLASIVERFSSSSRSEFVEAFASALKSVAPLSVTPGASSGVMGMSRYESDLRLSWSIVSSWLELWDGLLKLKSTSTIGTASSPTIDSKILSFCLLRITHASITPVLVSEWLPLVKIVASQLNAAQVSFELIRTFAATENATWPPPPNYLDGVVPGFEPIVLARKLPIGNVASNIAVHGVGALNIDATRIPVIDRAEYENNARGQGQDDERSFPIDFQRGGAVANALGRWPANVVADAEAGALLDAQVGDLKAGGSIGAHTAAAAASVRTGSPAMGDHASARGEWVPHGDSGGPSRFFYCPKVTRGERDFGCEHLPIHSGGEATDREDGSAGTKSPRAGAGRTGGVRNRHPTLKPVSLLRWLTRLVSPPGGLVLDPFCGAGSGGMAARLEGMDYIGLDLSAEYLTYAHARISAVDAGRWEEAA